MTVRHRISYGIEGSQRWVKGFVILIALLVEFRPVSNAAVQSTDMNVVEMISRVDPVTAAIVYLEMEVGQADVVLDTGQVGGWREELVLNLKFFKAWVLPIISASGNLSAKFLGPVSECLSSFACRTCCGRTVPRCRSRSQHPALFSVRQAEPRTVCRLM